MRKRDLIRPEPKMSWDEPLLPWTIHELEDKSVRTKNKNKNVAKLLWMLYGAAGLGFWVQDVGHIGSDLVVSVCNAKQ